MAMRDYRERAGNRREQMVALVWERYEKTLAEENSLDFDDLLVRALTLLRESPKTLSLLQNRWRYLTIDEYQDTNTTQYEIARLLAGERKNICAVGDIDQLIYQWRGADMANLLSFEKNFLNSTVILLEQNYRSTRTILAAANSVIEKIPIVFQKHFLAREKLENQLQFTAQWTSAAKHGSLWNNRLFL